MPLNKVNAKTGWWVSVVLLAVVTGIFNPVDIPGTSAQENHFLFTAHGDHGPYDSPEMLASLNALADTGAAFSLGLGDLDYESVGDEQRWCETVQGVMGPTYPFEIVMGNHEDESRLNGYIGNYVRYCPDRLNVQGIYGAEYYFDYPAADPLMRVIIIGAGNDWDWNGDGTLETSEVFDYESSDPDHQAHLAWLTDAIDSARVSGVPWVVVGMHKNCLTMGEKSCEIGPELMNVLVEKRVDLILQGHDHTYQRSKQLALGATCAAIPVDAYNSGCVADDGADGVYAKGAGSVLIVSGHFGGRDMYDISLDDPEAGYFAKAMGANGWVDFAQPERLHPDVTRGFVTFDVSESQIVVKHVSTTLPTTFADSFVISSDAALASTPPAATAPVQSPTATPSPTASPTPLDDAIPSPITTQANAPTTMTFFPVADAYVSQDQPDTNYGRNTALRTDAAPEIRSYLRFDTQGVSGTVLRATLRVYALTASSNGYDVRVVGNNDWTESGLTFAAAPAVDVAIATSGAIVAETWTMVDVTALVTGGGIFDLALTGTSSTAANYSSREGTNSPELIIDFYPAPPTATPIPTNTLTPTDVPGALVLTPVSDAYVHAANPDANYGASPSLRTDASPEIRSYLRFEPSGLDGAIVRATLRLYALSPSNTGYRVHRVTDQPWDERVLTFTTAPAVGDSVVSSSAVSPDTWVTVDVTALVTGDGPLTLALTTTSSTAVKYSSREGVHAPELVIEIASELSTPRPALTVPPTAIPLSATPTLSPTPRQTQPSATPTPG